MVRPDDPAALAKGLMRLAADPALVARMGAAARTRIETGGFTEEAVTRAVCAIYAELAPR